MTSTRARDLKRGQHVRIEGDGVVTRDARLTDHGATAIVRWSPTGLGVRESVCSYTYRLPADHPVKHVQ